MVIENLSVDNCRENHARIWGRIDLADEQTRRRRMATSRILRLRPGQKCRDLSAVQFWQAGDGMRDRNVYLRINSKLPDEFPFPGNEYCNYRGMMWSKQSKLE